MKSLLRRHYLNYKGWSTKEKLVVIQSDDWGSLRTSDLASLFKLKELGVSVEKCRYMQFDTVASDCDLQRLFEVLQNARDNHGNSAVLTANTLVSNPDFDRIEASEFESYHSVGLKQTFDILRNKTDEYKLGLSLWKQGQEAGVFVPQLHGNEHLQVNRWLRQLRAGNEVLLEAFKWRMWGVSRHTSPLIEKSLQAAFEYDTEKDKSFILKRIEEAISEFQTLFGFPSTTFTSPNYTWFPEVEEVLWNGGVRFLQSSSVQRIPTKDNIEIQRHFIGERSRSGLLYQVRNVHFEPIVNQNINWADNCLREIRTAFLWWRPAIISTHRVNYIGKHNSENREQSLKQLEELLRRIVSIWPSVQFISAGELGKRMEQKN